MKDDDTKRRVLADLRRFEAMRGRIGVLPTEQDFYRIKGVDPDAQRKRGILKLVLRSHTLIAHIASEIIESEDHSYDVRKEELVNSLWHEIVAMRDVVPLAEAALESGKNLDLGRHEGVKARQEASRIKIETIETVVKDLLNSDENKNMTAEEMRDYMHAPTRNLSPYSPSSTLSHIKKFISQIKKKS